MLKCEQRRVGGTHVKSLISELATLLAKGTAMAKKGRSIVIHGLLRQIKRFAQLSPMAARDTAPKEAVITGICGTSYMFIAEAFSLMRHR